MALQAEALLCRSAGGLQPHTALLQAWLPWAVGWKGVWWESVAAPDDVEEGAFRQQLR